ncbi:unnamed protein product, partial [Hapterophycus canaliculatus]
REHINKSTNQILDLPSRANSTVIKSHYRRLSLKYHPDKNPGNRSEANKKFNRIAKAYKVTKRKRLLRGRARARGCGGAKGCHE